jgi:hypothetical protein
VSAERKALEEIWRKRLEDAKLQVLFAQNFVSDVKREMHDVPPPDSSYAYQEALKAETFAREKYNSVLRVYRALLVGGEIPKEDERQEACEPSKARLTEQIRAAMTEIVELNRQQLEATVRGDHKTFKALEAALTRFRAHREALLRLYEDLK